jgi:predicted metalloprotease with PDZ domain
MRLRFFVSLALLAAVLGAAFLHAEEGKCSASSRECTQQIRKMLGGRRYLGVQVVELKPGLVIKTVLPDSPASRVQLKAGDRLIGVNGRSLTQANASQFKQYLAEVKDTGKILLIVQRRGAYRRIEVRLEPYPEEYIEKVISGHLSQAHTATAGAQP